MNIKRAAVLAAAIISLTVAAVAVDAKKGKVLVWGDYRGELAGSPRIEAVARAMCRAQGIDPDYVGFPYPSGPVWEFYIPQAVVFLAAYDAAKGAP